MVGLSSRSRASLNVGVDAILSLELIVVVAVPSVSAAVPQHLDDAVVGLDEGLRGEPAELRRGGRDGDEAGEQYLKETKEE